MYWYHQETKHSYQSVRGNSTPIDWSDQPSAFKNYPESYGKYRLNPEKEEDSFLYHIAGLTAKKRYPGVEYYLRINPSAGALYPNELYFQARGVEGIEDGIYHFEVSHHTLTKLVNIEKGEGIEPYLGFDHAMQGYLFLVSALYYRSSWKYKKRAFRYCLLDAGHLLGSIEAAALLKPHAVQMHYQLDRETLNRMFGFEKREFFLSAAVMGRPLKGQRVEPIEFSLPYVEGSGSFEPNIMIEQAYQETCDIAAAKKVISAPKFTFQQETLKSAIFTRRSQRGFEKEPISKGQFHYIMEMVTQPIMSDCDEEVNLYVVVNRVVGVPQGIYKEGVCLKEGDFAYKAGYLCLEQYHLAEFGAVTFFLTSKAENYQALYQKAGILGHRLYVVTNYLDIGCSGIGAYYDDEVNAFLENDEMVLYALAIGK